jgi:hypothetical protein
VSELAAAREELQLHAKTDAPRGDFLGRLAAPLHWAQVRQLRYVIQMQPGAQRFWRAG